MKPYILTTREVIVGTIKQFHSDCDYSLVERVCRALWDQGCFDRKPIPDTLLSLIADGTVTVVNTKFGPRLKLTPAKPSAEGNAQS